ncbi:DUF4333 domain-containing protein [Micromonospora sp. ALFpr18c]|uniref:DUF4333 domain-containing protein n=1 Tax=unclassified Micromonospora TaxID=2617518 RepID=UPI00124BC738|nr:DUF4333 domain-containing protein [Micromonospora sp. ALFpr18c]KAB1947693.1 DUF4333 domain-containing protein [Micromonospora sp. ALFpr18c]
MSSPHGSPGSSDTAGVSGATLLAPRWKPAPPPQWGPTTAASGSGGRRRPSARLVVAVAVPVVLLIVVGTVLAVLRPGRSDRKVLDTAALQRQVLTVLRNDYKLDADGVACPVDQPVIDGHRFTCTADVAGTTVTTWVTVRGTGQLEVARPR